MNILNRNLICAVLAAAVSTSALGGIQIAIGHNPNDQATAKFHFQGIPAPARNDPATQAQFILVDGRRDANGGNLDVLHDGRAPTEEDQPGDNFFFTAGADGGRLLIDLGEPTDVSRINTYSWHPGARGPQVYNLFAGKDGDTNFVARVRRGTDPGTCGWKCLAQVDTRPKTGEPGGQYGVSIHDPDGILGRFRYLLLDIFRTESGDGFGNTFYSEIDVWGRGTPAPMEVSSNPVRRQTVPIEGGIYEATLDTTDTPDLQDWVEKEVIPMVQEWYPKLVQLLPGEGFEAPRKFSITFSKDMQGVAATGGTRIRCAAQWFRGNLKGEAKGAILHEMVHVVQQYGRGRRGNPAAGRVPGWLTEGLTDYIRWYLYEPASHGAEITSRNLARARYDGNYRITANFLNWVINTCDRNLLVQLNTSIREGRYDEEFWKKRTGRTIQDLGAEWRAALEKKLGGGANPKPAS